MRALKVLLTAILAAVAIAGGLLLTAIVAAASVLLLLARRILGRQQVRTASAESTLPRATAAPSDVIEVTATEVPVDTRRP